MLAKMASRAAKPDGLLVIEPDREAAFLRPLPVEALWGVGLVTADKLRAHGIDTIGELERRDEGELALFLGAHAARHLHAIAHAATPAGCAAGPRRRSIGTQSAFAGGGRSGSDLDALLVTLVDRVTRRARAANRAGRTVTLRFRFADFSRATRSRTLAHPTAGTGAILAAARALLAAARPLIERRGITLLGITVANLSHEAQLELPLDPRVDPALDLRSTRSASASGPRRSGADHLALDAPARHAGLRPGPRVGPCAPPG